MKAQSTKSAQRASVPSAEFVHLAGPAPAHPLQHFVDCSRRQTRQADCLAQLQHAPATDSPNGLPHHLRTGIEALSGMDMGDVVVHRNSAKPAQMNALAYAQGREIHLGAGQEQHLPHEAWHVVQQAQNRVRQTRQLAAGVPVNDDPLLEAEADRKGREALRVSGAPVQRAGVTARMLPGAIAGGTWNSWRSPVQRAEWGAWEGRFGLIAPKIERIAKLGMAIVEFLRLRGIMARIGGSLAASMYGGQRRPVDIDIDVPGNPDKADLAKERFMKLRGCPIVVGRELFLLGDMTKTSSGINVIYRHVVTEEALESPIDEDNEVFAAALSRADRLPRFSVDVDFTSEAIFALSGLTADKEEDPKGHYGPYFLLAAYLKRLASNAERREDPKDDRGQIKSILVKTVNETLGQGISGDAIRATLQHVKAQVFGEHVSSTNTNTETMSRLYDEICPEVIREIYFI